MAVVYYLLINFSSKMSVRKPVYGLDEAMDSSNPVQINPLWKYTKESKKKNTMQTREEL